MSAPAAAARTMAEPLTLTLWGVRGSIPTPGRETVRYGGETTCLEIRAGDNTILIDCGSGVRLAGSSLFNRKVGLVDVIFSHTHLDHICGLPFFGPAYDPSVEVNLWAGHIPPGGTLQDIVERMMSPPIFPVATSALRNTHFRNFHQGEPIRLTCGIEIATTRLNHPGNCTGFRIEHGGGTLAIVTDHEHGNAALDDAVAEFVTGADVMIYDAMYREAEYPSFVGWGHSTPERALELAARSGVARPIIFHHDPRRTDAELDEIRAFVAAQHGGADVARQGETLAITPARAVAPGDCLP